MSEVPHGRFRGSKWQQTRKSRAGIVGRIFRQGRKSLNTKFGKDSEYFERLKSRTPALGESYPKIEIIAGRTLPVKSRNLKRRVPSRAQRKRIKGGEAEGRNKNSRPASGAADRSENKSAKRMQKATGNRTKKVGTLLDAPLVKPHRNLFEG